MTKIKPKNNSANMTNANKGTRGTNRQYDQAQGNRGKQIQSGHKTKTASYSPNDDRSNSKNPNNRAYEEGQKNRAEQLNPNNPKYQGVKRGKRQ